MVRTDPFEPLQNMRYIVSANQRRSEEEVRVVVHKTIERERVRWLDRISATMPMNASVYHKFPVLVYGILRMKYIKYEHRAYLTKLCAKGVCVAKMSNTTYVRQYPGAGTHRYTCIK